MTCQWGMSKLLEWYGRGQSCLRQENPWEPRSQYQKNQNRIAQFDYVRCVRPWFVTCIIPEKPRISKLKMVSQLRQITPFSRQITPFTRQITPLKNVEVWQK